MARRSLAPRGMAISRRRAAMHEAAHFVIGCHFIGGSISAQIFELENTLGRRWGGQVQILSTKIRANIKHRRMLGIAGIVGEALWIGEAALDLLNMEPEIVSDTDWKLFGGEPDDWTDVLPALDYVEILLTKHLNKAWHSAGRTLIKDGGIHKEIGYGSIWPKHLADPA